MLGNQNKNLAGNAILKSQNKSNFIFPDLNDIDDDFYDFVEKSLFTQKVMPNQKIMSSGDNCSHFGFLKSGSINVFMKTKSGREVKLYTLTNNDFCVLNTMCLICDGNFPGSAISNTDVEIVMVESSIFKRLMHESNVFRHFIFEGLQNQLGMLLTRFEDAYAPPIDEKLALLLMQKSDNGANTIHITQDQLAKEVGTVREIISRHMCFFKDNEWIHYTRGAVFIDKPEVLSELARITEN